MAKSLSVLLALEKGQDFQTKWSNKDTAAYTATDGMQGKCKIIAAGENTVGKPHAGSQHQEGIESKLWGTEPLDWVTQEPPPPSVKAQLRTEGGDATDAWGMSTESSLGWTLIVPLHNQGNANTKSRCSFNETALSYRFRVVISVWHLIYWGEAVQPSTSTQSSERKCLHGIALCVKLSSEMTRLKIQLGSTVITIILFFYEHVV